MKFVNTGKVEQVKDGIVFASGLSDVGYNETVSIITSQGEVKGLVLNLETEHVGIVVLGDFIHIKEGDSVEVEGRLLGLKVSEEMIGNVINPLGETLGSDIKVLGQKGKDMPLEKTAPGVITRENVKRPLLTGILGIDAIIPIGKGQRQLVIGDRQTGKTSICLDTIINQTKLDTLCIYVSIGQKASRLAQITQKLKDSGALSNVIVVAANAADPAALQYIAPYAGTSIAEYFCEKGKDVLIVYDDLTKHAWSYREISLLLRRPPGREAYPGDIFYLHSRLLERALQFSQEHGSGSITALPVVETQAGDVSAYIPTNIISITDGQIFLDAELFNKGQLPAINFGTSVSRVGGDAQNAITKQLAGKLKLELAQYREMQAFSQFGSDLDKETKIKLEQGARIMQLLKQKMNQPYSLEEEVLILFCGTQGVLDNVPIAEINAIMESLRKKVLDTKNKVLATITGAIELNSKLSEGQIKDMKTELLLMLKK